MNAYAIVDGSQYLFRAFHALPPLTSASGMPTNAIKGVAAMLRNHLAQLGEYSLSVVFDAPGKTFRHDHYPEYKANRPPTPQDLTVQIEPLHALVRAMGLPLLCVPGVEADDVIGTLARNAALSGHKVLICSRDKDLAQLVTPQILLYDADHYSTMGANEVLARFGVTPEHMTDYLGLVGDSSDNIPGVAGIGVKTAVALISQLGRLEDIYANLDRVAELPIRGAAKIGEKLRAQRDLAFLSRQLATIDTNVQGCDLAQLEMREPDVEALRNLYQTLSFKAWEEELSDSSRAAPPTKKSAPVNDIVTDEATWEAWSARLREARKLAFSCEVRDPKTADPQVSGFAVSVSAEQSAYVPLNHNGTPTSAKVLRQLKRLLEDPLITVHAHDLKTIEIALASHDIRLASARNDSMLMSYLLDSGEGRHDLASVAARHLGPQAQHNLSPRAPAPESSSPQTQAPSTDLDEAAERVCGRAQAAWRLCQKLPRLLDKQPQLASIYKEIELPLVSVLADLEMAGMLIDSEALKAQGVELRKRTEKLQQLVFEHAGREFNLNSPKQLQQVLFEELALPKQRKTPGGQASTAEPVLQELAMYHPVPRLTLEYRSLNKLLSTYIDVLPQRINPRTGRIHTTFSQAVTATGRLSSSDPNLQNIPMRTEEGRQIRRAFIAAPGNRLISADYSQVELRIMAHLSGDEGLLKAFAEGKDIHQATAAEIFDKPLDQVDAELRRKAKAINFGLIYGMSPFGLARQLRIPLDEAQDYTQRYFSRYPGTKRYMEETRRMAREQGYVETLFGRQLRMPDINSRNGRLRQAAERAAINAPMQGTAADIIKKAMIEMADWLRREAPQAQMTLQVHDELVIEAPCELSEEIAKRTERIMSGVAELNLPLTVHAGIGSNWEEAH